MQRAKENANSSFGFSGFIPVCFSIQAHVCDHTGPKQAIKEGKQIKQAKAYSCFRLPEMCECSSFRLVLTKPLSLLRTEQNQLINRAERILAYAQTTVSGWLPTSPSPPLEPPIFQVSWRGPWQLQTHHYGCFSPVTILQYRSQGARRASHVPGTPVADKALRTWSWCFVWQCASTLLAF